MVQEVGEEMRKIKDRQRGTSNARTDAGRNGTENALGSSPQAFTRETGFWEMNREEMVEKLARKIYDVRMSQDPNINKFIPGLNLDLRGPAIDLILGNQHITPRTPDAENYMRRWDRIQAERWLKHLEGEKYGRRREEAEKLAVAKPAPESRVAEATPEPRLGERKKKKEELTGGRKELFESLVQKARLEEIKKKFPKNMEGLSESERGRWERRGKALFRARRSLEYMVGNVPEKEIINFRDKIMDPFLDEYRRLKKEKEKTIGKNLAEEADELRKFKEDIREKMKEALSDRFSEESISLIINYYMKISDLEYLLSDSK